MNGAENGYGSCIKKGECGYAWFNSIVFYENLKRLRTEVDYLILVMHCGIEKIDLPIPEWRDYFKGLIDFFGVDAIIAHHPHVVQGYEKWHEGLIYYSLGNFIWDKQPLYSNETILVGLNIDKGKCIPEVIPVEIDDYKVKINNSIEFENKIDQLCKTLQSDSYESIVDNTLELIYEERYQPIFYDIIHMKNGKRNIIHNLYQIICQQKNLKDLSVFHNVGIESHQYCLRRISRKHLI